MNSSYVGRGNNYAAIQMTDTWSFWHGEANVFVGAIYTLTTKNLLAISLISRS
ncbi:hypothetical protein [Rhodanobacter sp. MP7CTX1]|uniref:hypothetical protein n=1 Tax=Rhodanobacter sp. MP7CTX1 TaxID=2723084 RepID=UPI001616C6CF|nr:hypothetical protein [Rhodanobacter sp. MP7CTX1]MBB6187635.1 hypothetical protein [Rhodanobacter sp. MP7CTX1]